MENKVLPFLVGAIFFANSFPGCVGAENRISLVNTNENTGICQFHLPQSSDMILIPVDYDGKQYLFVLDTGTTNSIFDSRLCGNLKKSGVVTVKGVYGEVGRLNEYVAPDARIGKLNIKNDGPVLGDDFSLWRNYTGLDIYGMIGMATLRKYVVQVDFDSTIVKFFSRKARVSETDSAEAFPLQYSSAKTPYITINMGRFGRIDWELDTGASGPRAGSLPFAVFDTLLRENSFETTSSMGLTTLRGYHRRTARIPHFRIGGLEYSNLIFYEDSVALLGLDFLRRHLVTFDFPNNCLYLKPARDYSRLSVFDMSGLTIDRNNEHKHVMVTEVKPDSPAQESGFAKGDILLKINQADLPSLSLYEIRNLLSCGDGVILNVLIRRDGTDTDLQIKLKKTL